MFLYMPCEFYSKNYYDHKRIELTPEFGCINFQIKKEFKQFCQKNNCTMCWAGSHINFLKTTNLTPHLEPENRVIEKILCAKLIKRKK